MDTLNTHDEDTLDSITAQEAPELDSGHEPTDTRSALEAAFAKAEAASAPAPAEAPAPTDKEPAVPEAPAQPEVVTPQPALKAPQAWKADVRQKFDLLDDEVKQEVLRRENEISSTLAKTANERRLAQEFMQSAAPYEATYRAMGIDSMNAAQQLFAADHTLRSGSPAAKAQLVGRLINEFGVDLDALNDVINGRGASAPQAPGHDPQLAARLANMEAFAAEQRAAAAQAQQSQINTTIDQFANDPKNEFFNDVAPHMIGLLQSGVATDLQSAYEQACYANPSVRKALLDRENAQKARLAAGNASLPVKGPRNPVQPAAQKFKSTRDALEAAFAAHSKQDRV